jgi:hypothetical protein
MSATTTLHMDIYYTEMPISVKMIDDNGNEITNTIPVTFYIDCNGYSRSITLTSSGTLSGYHPYDNNIIESFSISCSPGKMYYKDENGNYVAMPEITSYNQFSSYYHKGGAIYIMDKNIVATTSATPSTSPTSTSTKQAKTVRYGFMWN